MEALKPYLAFFLFLASIALNILAMGGAMCVEEYKSNSLPTSTAIKLTAVLAALAIGCAFTAGLLLS